MCGNFESIYFMGTALIALLSIFFVWLGKKYKFTYYNSLLLGWFGYFILLIVLQYHQQRTNQYKLEKLLG